MVEQGVDADAVRDPSAHDVAPRHEGALGWVVWSLIVLATLIVLGATVNTWVKRQVLDTDQWVSVTDDLLANDAVRDALSTYVAAELFREVDVTAGLEQLLPEQLSGLAGPIAASLDASAVNVVDRLLDTDAVRTAWSKANRTAHQLLVKVLEGDTAQVLSTSDGSLTIDLHPLVVSLGERLGLSDQVIERIPDDAGQLVVLDSQKLDDAQQFVSVIEVVSMYLFVVVVALYALAVYLARGRRRETLRNEGWAIAAAGALMLIGRRLSHRVAVEQLASATGPRDAVGAIVDIGTSLFRELAWAGVSIGLVIVVYTVLVGPSRPAVSLRRFAAPLLTNTFGLWVAALAVLAAMLLFLPGFSVQRWLPAIVLIVLFVTGVEYLRRQARREAVLDVTS